MAQIGTIGLETETHGTIKVPVFEIGDSGVGVFEFIRVQTDGGKGFIPVSKRDRAEYNYFVIQSENNGKVALHDTKAFQRVYPEIGETDANTNTLYREIKRLSADGTLQGEVVRYNKDAYIHYGFDPDTGDVYHTINGGSEQTDKLIKRTRDGPNNWSIVWSNDIQSVGGGGGGTGEVDVERLLIPQSGSLKSNVYTLINDPSYGLVVAKHSQTDGTITKFRDESFSSPSNTQRSLVTDGDYLYTQLSDNSVAKLTGGTGTNSLNTVATWSFSGDFDTILSPDIDQNGNLYLETDGEDGVEHTVLTAYSDPANQTQKWKRTAFHGNVTSSPFRMKYHGYHDVVYYYSHVDNEYDLLAVDAQTGNEVGRKKDLFSNSGRPFQRLGTDGAGYIYYSTGNAQKVVRKDIVNDIFSWEWGTGLPDSNFSQVDAVRIFE